MVLHLNNRQSMLHFHGLGVVEFIIITIYVKEMHTLGYSWLSILIMY